MAFLIIPVDWGKPKTAKYGPGRQGKHDVFCHVLYQLWSNIFGPSLNNDNLFSQKFPQYCLWWPAIQSPIVGGWSTEHKSDAWIRETWPANCKPRLISSQHTLHLLLNRSSCQAKLFISEVIMSKDVMLNSQCTNSGLLYMWGEANITLPRPRKLSSWSNTVAQLFRLQISSFIQRSALWLYSPLKSERKRIKMLVHHCTFYKWCNFEVRHQLNRRGIQQPIQRQSFFWTDWSLISFQVVSSGI